VWTKLNWIFQPCNPQTWGCWSLSGRYFYPCGSYIKHRWYIKPSLEVRKTGKRGKPRTFQFRSWQTRGWKGIFVFQGITYDSRLVHFYSEFRKEIQYVEIRVYNTGTSEIIARDDCSSCRFRTSELPRWNMGAHIQRVETCLGASCHVWLIAWLEDS
jgi:hypothetical protein